jgi:hypothetical protein
MFERVFVFFVKRYFTESYLLDEFPPQRRIYITFLSCSKVEDTRKKELISESLNALKYDMNLTPIIHQFP